MPKLRVPSLGEGITTAKVLYWRKTIGESITSGEYLGELETEKATVSIPSPQGGVLLRVFKESGQSVPVGEALCDVDPETDASHDACIQTERSASAPPLDGQVVFLGASDGYNDAAKSHIPEPKSVEAALRVEKKVLAEYAVSSFKVGVEFPLQLIAPNQVDRPIGLGKLRKTFSGNRQCRPCLKPSILGNSTRRSAKNSQQEMFSSFRCEIRSSNPKTC